MPRNLMMVVCSIGFFVLGAILMLVWKTHEEDSIARPLQLQLDKFLEADNANHKSISESLSVLCTKINDPSYMRVCFHLKTVVDTSAIK
jgi:hypothetical protein